MNAYIRRNLLLSRRALELNKSSCLGDDGPLDIKYPSILIIPDVRTLNLLSKEIPVKTT